jgi:serine/threonine-protein kinase
VIGRTVGNYRVLELLGEGGMGAVYLAEHPGMGRRAAIKVLHRELAQSEELAARFFNEARAANAIRHPGIVEIFDLGTLPDGATYITMELLEGQSLAERLRRGPIPIAAAVDLAGQAASALSAAHAAGIVHRDLKPDNIFLVPDPQAPDHDLVKVLDFGIAKLAVASGPGSGSVRTRTGVVMGTPLYMSPEQCRGTKEVDHRSDIYSLGVILYEMVCGRPPFVSEGHGELIHMHIGEPPPPARAHNPEVPASLEAILMRALTKDPGQRFQTMDQLLRALRGSPTPAWAVAPGALRSAPHARLGEAGPPQTTLSSASASIIEEVATLRPRRRGLKLAGLVVAAGIVALAIGASKWKTLRPGPTAPAAPVVAPTPSPVEPTAAPPATIVVNIASAPAGARVVRESDGALLGETPLSRSWPRASGATRLRLELAGYEPQKIVVPLDLGVDLKIALARAAPPAPRASGSDVKRRKLTPAHPAPTPPPPPPPTRTRPEPVPL